MIIIEMLLYHFILRSETVFEIRAQKSAAPQRI